jgi:creatinine amidohydrolase
MSQWNLAETTLGLAQEQPYEVAVLPVGATEAHGYHLPYATDTIQCERIAEQACALADKRGARVLLLPAIPYGVNENNLGFKWTMSVRPSTLFGFITDLVRSAEHHGIPKMILLNGHGGNEFQPLLRELCTQTSVELMLVNWYAAASEAHARIFEAPGEHGDEMETSLMMHFRGDLVHMDLAGDGSTREAVLTAMKERWGWIARPWDRLTLDSSLGNPAKATPEKGAEYVAAVVEKLAELLVEMSNAGLDDLYPYKA